MFCLIKQLLPRLLNFCRFSPSIGNASNHTKYIFLNNQQRMTQPTLINLHPNEHSQELRYYLFAVSLDRCVGKDS